MEGAETTTKLADVTINADRGAKRAHPFLHRGTVRRPDHPPDDDRSGRFARPPHPRRPTDAHPRSSAGSLVRFPSKITAISGNEITLERPLRLDVRTPWTPEIRSFSGQLEEVGLEDFTMEFPTREYQGHFNEDGFNGIWMDGAGTPGSATSPSTTARAAS